MKKFNSDLVSSLVLCIFSIGAFIYTLTGKWSAGAGRGGARLFPQLAAAVIFCSALMVLLGALKRKEQKQMRFPEVGLMSAFLFFGMGALCVFLSLNVGVVVGNLIYLVLAFLLLSPAPLKEFRFIFITAGLSGAGFWILFIFFANMLLPNPILF